MTHPQSTNERRQAMRYSLKVTIRTDDCMRGGESLDNVSQSGACIKTPLEYENGELILVNFFFSGDLLCMPASIRWKKNSSGHGYTYGVEFFNSGSTFFLEQRKQFQEYLSRSIAQRKAVPVKE